jgi:hypothetical protein
LHTGVPQRKNGLLKVVFQHVPVLAALVFCPALKNPGICRQDIAVMERQMDSFPLNLFEVLRRQSLPEMFVSFRMKSPVQRFHLDLLQEQGDIAGSAFREAGGKPICRKSGQQKQDTNERANDHFLPFSAIHFRAFLYCRTVASTFSGSLKPAHRWEGSGGKKQLAIQIRSQNTINR